MNFEVAFAWADTTIQKLNEGSDLRQTIAAALSAAYVLGLEDQTRNYARNDHKEAEPSLN